MSQTRRRMLATELLDPVQGSIYFSKNGRSFCQTRESMLTGFVTLSFVFSLSHLHRHYDHYDHYDHYVRRC